MTYIQKAAVLSVALIAVLTLGWANRTEEAMAPAVEEVKQEVNQHAVIEEYLRSKGSPLADHTETLLAQKNWKLLIAISAIESQFCKRKIAYNCWGIGGDSAYRHYDGYDEAIVDAEQVIEGWQAKGRWLTVSDMNGHYVVPYNPNWEAVVNRTLQEIENLLQ